MRHSKRGVAAFALLLAAGLGSSPGRADDDGSDPGASGGATISLRAPGLFLRARLVPAQGNAGDPIFMEYNGLDGDVTKSGHPTEIEILGPGRVSVDSSSNDPSKAAGALTAAALLAMTGRVPDPEEFVTGVTGVPVHVTRGDPAPGISEETAAFLAQLLGNLVLADAGSDAQAVYTHVLATVTPPAPGGAGGVDASCCPLDVVVQPQVGGHPQYLVQQTNTSPPSPVVRARVMVCGGHSVVEPNIVPCYGTLTDDSGLATFDGHLGPSLPTGFPLQKLTVELDPLDAGPVCLPPISFGQGLVLQQGAQASTCGAPPGSAGGGGSATVHNVLSPGALLQQIGNETYVCNPPGAADCGIYAVTAPLGGGDQALSVYTDAGASVGAGVEVDVCTQGYDAYGNAFPQPTCGFTAITNSSGVAVFDGQAGTLVPASTALASVVIRYQGQACTPPVTAPLVAPPPLF
jgi:hypothetical protein